MPSRRDWMSEWRHSVSDREWKADFSISLWVWSFGTAINWDNLWKKIILGAFSHDAFFHSNPDLRWLLQWRLTGKSRASALGSLVQCLHNCKCCNNLPTTLHLAANMQEVTAQWSKKDYIINKSTDAILRSPKWMCCPPHIHPEIVLKNKQTNKQLVKNHELNHWKSLRLSAAVRLLFKVS